MASANAPMSEELRTQVKGLCLKAFDARDKMAELAFWDVRWSTVHECFNHCHGGKGNRAQEINKHRRLIERIQGELAKITDGIDWYNANPEINRWYDEEDDRRVKALGVLFVEQDY